VLRLGRLWYIPRITGKRSLFWLDSRDQFYRARGFMPN
jgi:hypothetical protein